MEINKLCDVVRETSFAIQLVFVSFGVFCGHEGFRLACP
jgi:hypothetical protein